MPRKGENIYKRKDGRWEGRYIKGKNQEGKTTYGYVYAKTYKDVREKLTLAKHNIIRLEKKDFDFTFSQISKKWLEEKKLSVKISSYNKYRNTLEKYVIPKLGNIQISKLSIIEIEKLCMELLSNGGNKKTGLSSKTVSDILSIVRSILLYAEKYDFHPLCNAKEINIKIERHDISVISKQDQEILIHYLKSEATNCDIGILLCLFTGIRIGELCALRNSEISVSTKTLSIISTMQRIQCFDEGSNSKTKIVITPPKSSCSKRCIPLPDCIIPYLENIKKDDDSFFLTGSKTKYIEPRSMQNYFKRILKENNIQETNFHALRHTFATNCVELGFETKSLSEILGHSNVSITLNRYVHPSMAQKKKNMQLLSELFSV